MKGRQRLAGITTSPELFFFPRSGAGLNLAHDSAPGFYSRVSFRRAWRTRSSAFRWPDPIRAEGKRTCRASRSGRFESESARIGRRSFVDVQADALGYV